MQEAEIKKTLAGKDLAAWRSLNKAIALAFFAAFALAGCMRQGQQDLAFDRGGVSLDLSKCLVSGGDTVGENLFPAVQTAEFNIRNDPDGWKLGINNKGLDKTLFNIELKQGILSVHNSFDLAKHLNERGEPSVSSGGYRTVPLSKGGSYTLSFEAYGEVWRGAGNSQAVVSWTMLDADRKKITDSFIDKIPLNPDSVNCSLEILAPLETRYILIVFRLYGLGKVNVKNIELRQKALRDEIEIALFPQTYMDNIFSLASGQAGTLYFMQSNKAKIALKNPELHLELPEGFEMIGGSFLYTPANPAGRHWVFPLDKCNISEKDYWLPPIVIKAQWPAGDTLYPVTYYTSNAGVDGVKKNFQLRIIPAIAGRRPKSFKTGYFSTSLHRFNQPVFDPLLDFYVKCGFNFVKGAYTPDMIKGYSEADFTMAWWSTNPGPCDGFDMGARNKPRDVSYIQADGSVLAGGRNGPFICPQEAADKGEHYREFVIKPLRAIIREKKYNMIINNWEPQDNFKGCFCERCREAFIRYTKLDPETVRAAWPQDVLNNWRELWPAFRSWQLGKMVSNVEEDLATMNVHFVPALTSEAMRDASYQLYHHYNPEEFIRNLPWICAWSPYLYHDMKMPYSYNNASYLRVFLNARQVNAFLEKRIPEPEKRPKLITFPHQSQCFTWMTVPEAPAFENLTYFINGWAASMIYFLPMGADHVTYKMLAEANTAIANVEEFVFAGQPCPDPIVEAVTPLPASHYLNSKDSRLPGLENAALIQSAAWEKDHRRLIGVGNFWQRGEVFCKLKVDGLDAKTEYILDLPLHKARFTGDNGKFFTGKELAEGVLLQVGGLRWIFYVLSPYSQNTQNATIYTPADVKRIMAQRLPEILKAVEWEKSYADKLKLSHQQDEAPDYSSFSSKNHAGVSGSCSDGVAEFVVGDQKLRINLLEGAGIESWLAGGKELCAPGFSFAKEGTWLPNAFIVKGPFKFVALSEIPGGLELQLSRRLSPLETKVYRGLLIHKTYQITEQAVKLISKIENSSGESQSFAFRWHNVVEKDFQKLSFGPVEFSRAFDIRGYRPKKVPGEFIAGYKGKLKAISIPDVTGTFSTAGDRLALQFLPEPKAELDLFVTWGGSIAGDSFEPIFFPTTLTAGTSATYTLEIKLKRQAE